LHQVIQFSSRKNVNKYLHLYVQLSTEMQHQLTTLTANQPALLRQHNGRQDK